MSESVATQSATVKHAKLWKRAAKAYREAAFEWEHIARIVIRKDRSPRYFEQLTLVQARCTELLLEMRQYKSALERISGCNGGEGYMPELARKALER